MAEDNSNRLVDLRLIFRASEARSSPDFTVSVELSQLWKMLGAKDQTEAVAKLKQWTSLSQASADVFNERSRQQYGENWKPEHDDKINARGELVDAAIAYADDSPSRWPWMQSWYRPTTRRRDLVKAAALLIAEIERIDRAEARK